MLTDDFWAFQFEGATLRNVLPFSDTPMGWSRLNGEVTIRAMKK